VVDMLINIQTIIYSCGIYLIYTDTYAWYCGLIQWMLKHLTMDLVNVYNLLYQGDTHYITMLLSVYYSQL